MSQVRHCPDCTQRAREFYEHDTTTPVTLDELAWWCWMFGDTTCCPPDHLCGTPED